MLLGEVTSSTPCVFDKKRFWVQDFYQTFAQADVACQRANRESDDHPYITASYGVMLRMERKSLLLPAKSITRDRFWEMLEVLPPICWENDGILETFCMSEMWTGSYTNQFGRYGDKYAEKMVDLKDRETWLKLEDFQNV